MMQPWWANLGVPQDDDAALVGQTDQKANTIALSVIKRHILSTVAKGAEKWPIQHSPTFCIPR